MMAGLLLSGCAQTVAPAPNIIQRASGVMPAPPPPSGFLGNDYALLTPPTAGSDQNAVLRYINPNANWASYNKIMIAPVTFWAAYDNKVSAADQQALCNYMYTVMVTDLGKTFVIVDQPGPGVIKVSAALERRHIRGSCTAINFRRRAAGSRAQPHQGGATGTYAFVGSARGAKFNDSVTGQLLAAGADKRVGGAPSGTRRVAMGRC